MTGSNFFLKVPRRRFLSEFAFFETFPQLKVAYFVKCKRTELIEEKVRLRFITSSTKREIRNFRRGCAVMEKKY